MRRSLAVCGLAVLLGCAGDPASVTAPLTMGVDDDGDPAVVAIVFAADPSLLRCTGTLIAERVVLTAAHCDVESAPGRLAVFFGPDLRRAGTLVPILVGVVHPGADDTADRDLGLLLLAEPAPVAPLALATDASLAEPPPVAVRLVGFGQTAEGADDDVRRREGRSRTTEVAPEHVVLGADPSLPCTGDSGGPALVATAMGERVAGVISRGDPRCTERGRVTRIDVHLESFLRPALDAWAPGSVAVGERCLFDAHCASVRCAEALDEPALRFCAEPCAADADCAATLSCQETLCRYPTPTPGAFGAACSTHDDCVRGDCLEASATCSYRCVSGRGDCPSGATCEHLGGIDFYCVPEPAPTCGACAIRPAGPRATLALAFFLALALRARRTTRRAKRIDGAGSISRSNPVS